MGEQVILSGLADEGPVSKRAEAQLTMIRALGMSWYSPRFVDLGGGVKNVMALTGAEVAALVELHREFEVRVATLGSPIGKVKLFDFNDGTSNRFVPFEDYLAGEVAQAIELAQAFETKLIRGFSFYPPKHDDPFDHIDRAAELLRAICVACDAADLFFGLEVEANLVGRNGELEMALFEAIDHPRLLLVFDGANIACQGYTTEQVYEQYLAMREGIGWIHVKDYLRRDDETFVGHVDEEMLTRFVPCDRGSSGYARIFADVKRQLPAWTAACREWGLPGVIVDLEPHVKGGGQFGGFSGPDGFGVALRALCRVLDSVGIGYDLTVYEDLRKA